MSGIQESNRQYMEGRADIIEEKRKTGLPMS